MKEKVLMTASAASMIDQFNMPNIRLLQRMGYEVHVACNFRKGNTCDKKRIQKLKRTLSEWQVFWHQWDCTRNVRCAAGCCRAYGQLLQLMRQNRFAWVHCHSPIGGVLTRIAAHQAGVPVLYTAHGFHFYQGAPLWNWVLYYPVEKLLSYWTDILITVNREDYKFAKKYLKAGKTVYIPGVGIHTDRFGASAERGPADGFYEKYRIPEDAVILLSVGELSRRKNHAAVISALAQLGRQDLYYIICGQGAYRKKLMRAVQKLGVSEYVRLAGYQENMPDIYQHADLFVFPSLQEGLPAALMEAMAAGLPCIVSDIRGNRELIDGRLKAGRLVCQKSGGIRFVPGDDKQLQNALEWMLENEQQRRACGVYNKIKVQAYALPAVQGRMEIIYQDMKEDKPAAAAAAITKNRKDSHQL